MDSEPSLREEAVGYFNDKIDLHADNATVRVKYFQLPCQDPNWLMEECWARMDPCLAKGDQAETEGLGGFNYDKNTYKPSSREQVGDPVLHRNLLLVLWLDVVGSSAILGESAVPALLELAGDPMQTDLEQATRTKHVDLSGSAGDLAPEPLGGLSEWRTMALLPSVSSEARPFREVRSWTRAAWASLGRPARQASRKAWRRSSGAQETQFTRVRVVEGTLFGAVPRTTNSESTVCWGPPIWTHAQTAHPQRHTHRV